MTDTTLPPEAGGHDRIEPVEAPGEAMRPRLERYHWPLALALFAGLLAAAQA